MSRPEILPAEVRQSIEPSVRHALEKLTAAQQANAAGADAQEMVQRLHAVEYALGRMLPNIQGRLNVTLHPALAGKTFTVTAH